MSLNKRYTREEVLNIYSRHWNPLFEISINHNSTKLFDPECTHYLIHYWEYFKDLRSQDISILEIGVKEGDSLKIWQEFFSENTKIFGIELNAEPLKNFKLPNAKIYYGDQTDIPFLVNTVNEIGLADIIIDDGGHTQEQIKTSFEYLFRYGLKEGGLYVMEDLGCSYWHRWSGGLNNQNSIINFMKNKIDNINYRFWKGDRIDYVPKPNPEIIDATYWDLNIQSITFAKGLCFVRKGSNKDLSDGG